MGPSQPGKSTETPAQQLFWRLQLVVNEASRTLDAAQAEHPASQAEVEHLRSLIWSELTGLEAEFGREDGPRSDRVDRFFTHLLSSGNHIGQIEALGGALLGGAPPPSRPAPDSPVAGLHRLHSTLTEMRQRWQQLALPPEEQVPTVARRSDWKNTLADEAPGAREEEAPARSGRRVTSGPRITSRPERRREEPASFMESFGFGRRSAFFDASDTPRPRAIILFVTVIVLLGLLGVGVIYFGLNSTAQSTDGQSPSGTPLTQTSPLPASGTSVPTPTLSAAAPQLTILGATPLQVPCPTSSLSPASFIIKNSGGQHLTWSAQVNTTQISLDVSNGDLFGPVENANIVVTVTALTSKGSGTITITSNAGIKLLTYQIVGC